MFCADEVFCGASPPPAPPSLLLPSHAILAAAGPPIIPVSRPSFCRGVPPGYALYPSAQVPNTSSVVAPGAGRAPHRGTETCAVVEAMASLECVPPRPRSRRLQLLPPLPPRPRFKVRWV